MDLVERVARKRCERHIRNVRRHDTPPEELERMLPASVDYAWGDFLADTKEDIAEVLDAMGEVSEGMTHAGFMAREHRMNMGESANATWQAMLSQFKAENIDRP